MRKTFMKTAFVATKVMYSLDPKTYIKNFSVGIMQTLTIVGSTVLMQLFIDSLNMPAVINRYESICLLIGLGILTVISEVLNGYQNYLYGYYIDNGIKKLKELLHQKIDTLPRLVLDDANELARIERARKGIANLVELVLVVGDAITFYGLYFVFLGTYFCKINARMLLILPMVFIPVWLSHISKTKVFSDMDAEGSLYKLQMKHYIKCFKDTSYLRELRFLNAESFLARKLVEVIKKYQKTIFVANKKGAESDCLGKLITFIGTMLIIVFITAEMIQGRITVGVFGAVFATLKQMFSLMDELISIHFANALENVGTVEAVIELLDEKSVKNLFFDYTDFSKIVFKNVSFRYPNQKEWALSNVCFEIKRGEKIALVGLNGSGKSTLSKIILGLYKPESGQVIVERGEENSIKDSRTAVFQNYAKYMMSVEDNIRISDFAKEKSAEPQISLFANDLVEGRKKMLGRAFGGEELSGGQWQSVAIARGFYRDASLVVLDEPTASIDPIKENTYYDIFERELQDKTGIIVTHHLASVSLADRIILLNEGCIEENGSFEELMNAKGNFYKMYSAQAAAYTK